MPSAPSNSPPLASTSLPENPPDNTHSTPQGVFVSLPYSVGRFTEPPFKTPHHFSDIDTWKFPDRNYYVFICISFVFGFFGLDHFYLRSFGTGTQKFIFNIFTLGMWYFWDLTQIISDSKKVEAEGLTSPFDWTRGIGRGVFEDPVKKAAALQSGGKIVRTKKDIAIYAISAILFGIFGLDKLYLGQPIQAVAKLLTCFNIFIFLFGWMWVIWDIVKILFFTESVLKDGISPPPPFTLLFTQAIKANELFIPQEVSKEDLNKEKEAAAASGGLFSLPKLFDMGVFRFWYKELAVPLLQPTVGTTIQTVDKTVGLANKAIAVGGDVLATGPKIASAVTQNLASVTNPEKMMEQVQAAAQAKAASRQMGGSMDNNISSGPIVAGTLAAVVLAGACKFVSDILSSKK